MRRARGRGPRPGSRSCEHHHFDGYPADQRQTDNDCGNWRERQPADGDCSGQQRGEADKGEQDDPGHQEVGKRRSCQEFGRHPEEVSVRRQDERSSPKQRADAEEDLEHDGEPRDSRKPMQGCHLKQDPLWSR